MATKPSFSPGIIYGDVSEPLQSIYETSATQKYALGTKLVYGDGRVFRYAKNGGTALTKGLMTQSEAQDSKMHEIAQTGHAQLEGATDITALITTGSGLTDNELAEGFLCFNKVDHLAGIYKIVASKLQSTDTLLDLKLETPLREAVLATAEISIIKNRYADVIVVPTTGLTAAVAGVPLVDVAINYYCWLQTGGSAPMIVDTGETVVIGLPIGWPATCAVAGAVGPIAISGNAENMPVFPWGICQSVGAAAEPAFVFLMLD
jgi:hypothetical protein